MGRAYGDNFDDEAHLPYYLTGREHPHPGAVARPHERVQGHGPAVPAPASSRPAPRSCASRGTLDHEFMILVATSGDTGKAALEGFKRRRRRVHRRAVPRRRRERHPAQADGHTSAGDNVQVWAVRGNFDDCQTGVKHVFADEKPSPRSCWTSTAWRFPAPTPSTGGACMPQVRLLRLQPMRELVAGGQDRSRVTPIDVCVPTGNFGNILAAWYAKRMGVPIGHAAAAPATRTACSPTSSTRAPTTSPNRDFVLTPSPSMDILVLVEPGAPALRAHGPRRRGHSPAGWPTCADAASLPRGRRDVRAACGRTSAADSVDNATCLATITRSARRARLPAGSRTPLWPTPAAREPARREPRAHRQHGPLGKVRRQRVPRAARHRAVWRRCPPTWPRLPVAS